MNLAEIGALLKGFEPSMLLVPALMLFVFVLAFASRCMRNGSFNNTNATMKVCSFVILACALFFGLWPWIMGAKQSMELGQLQGTAWFSFITATFIIGVGPVLAGQYFGKRSQLIA